MGREIASAGVFCQPLLHCQCGFFHTAVLVRQLHARAADQILEAAAADESTDDCVVEYSIKKRNAQLQIRWKRCGYHVLYNNVDG